jgi:hypothetical protein
VPSPGVFSTNLGHAIVVKSGTKKSGLSIPHKQLPRQLFRQPFHFLAEPRHVQCGIPQPKEVIANA